MFAVWEGVAATFVVADEARMAGTRPAMTTRGARPALTVRGGG